VFIPAPAQAGRLVPRWWGRRHLIAWPTPVAIAPAPSEIRTASSEGKNAAQLEPDRSRALAKFRYSCLSSIKNAPVRAEKLSRRSQRFFNRSIHEDHVALSAFISSIFDWFCFRRGRHRDRTIS